MSYILHGWCLNPDFDQNKADARDFLYTFLSDVAPNPTKKSLLRARGLLRKGMESSEYLTHVCYSRVNPLFFNIPARSYSETANIFKALLGQCNLTTYMKYWDDRKVELLTPLLT